jgi:hypothetical protein
MQTLAAAKFWKASVGNALRACSPSDKKQETVALMELRRTAAYGPREAGRKAVRHHDNRAPDAQPGLAGCRRDIWEADSRITLEAWLLQNAREIRGRNILTGIA